MPDAHKIDAVRVPIGYGRGPDMSARLSGLQREFGPLLGATRIYFRHQGTFGFVTGDPADTLYFPASHPRHGGERYHWEDRGDGVFLGRLVSDDAPDAQATDQELARKNEQAIARLNAPLIPQMPGIGVKTDAR